MHHLRHFEVLPQMLMEALTNKKLMRSLFGASWPSNIPFCGRYSAAGIKNYRGVLNGISLIYTNIK